METNQNEIIKTKKKSMGRRKIEIKKIEKKSDLQVTLSKRRLGLFKKAGELSILTGVDIAILVESPAKKIYSFGNPLVESVIDRYIQGENSSLSSSFSQNVHLQAKLKYLEAFKKLKLEKETEKAIKEKSTNLEETHLWSTTLHDLEEYAAAIKTLKNNVMARANYMAMCGGHNLY